MLSDIRREILDGGPSRLPDDLVPNAPKMTRVRTDRTFKGDLEGTGMFPPLPRRARL